MVMFYMDSQMRGKALLTLSILLQSFSFLCIKFASLQTGFLVLGLLGLAACFIVGRAVVWQFVLQQYELSTAYPFTSLSQVLVFVYAVMLFQEHVELHHVAGVILMMAGLLVMMKKT